MLVQFGTRRIDLSLPRVMGIVNVTADSFFDGGELLKDGRPQIDQIIRKAQKMIAQGAAFIDIGGESTRPGAVSVSINEECDRVVPAVEAIAERFDTVVSVDTSSAQVMEEAVKRGAEMINDVRALEREGALACAVSAGVPVCLMHMQGTPATMQENPEYDDVIATVANYLTQRATIFIKEGGRADQILIDPGFGFGKTDEHNLTLLKNLSQLNTDAYPVLVGLSRKSIIGRLLGRSLEERLPASLSLAMVALQKGANILRVHDVAETIDVVKIFELTK